MSADGRQEIRASIIITTLNQANGLRRTLETINRMDQCDGEVYEVIVVDNNSSDTTGEIVSQFRRAWGDACLRYVRERNPGQAYARNAGIREARGRIVAFTDDDVSVDKSWLEEILRGFKNSAVDCVGGKILPSWEATPPSWLADNWQLESYRAVLALLDLGNLPRELLLEEARIGLFPWGANVAFRRSVFERFGLFNTRLGHVGKMPVGGEECDLVLRIREGGGIVLYWPAAVVHHRIPRARMKRSYFRRRYFADGIRRGMLAGDDERSHPLGIPVWSLRRAAREAGRWMERGARGDRKSAFMHQLMACHWLGRAWLARQKPKPRADHGKSDETLSVACTGPVEPGRKSESVL